MEFRCRRGVLPRAGAQRCVSVCRGRSRKSLSGQRTPEPAAGSDHATPRCGIDGAHASPRSPRRSRAAMPREGQSNRADPSSTLDWEETPAAFGHGAALLGTPPSTVGSSSGSAVPVRSARRGAVAVPCGRSPATSPHERASPAGGSRPHPVPGGLTRCGVPGSVAATRRSQRAARRSRPRRPTHTIQRGAVFSSLRASTQAAQGDLAHERR